MSALLRKLTRSLALARTEMAEAISSSIRHLKAVDSDLPKYVTWAIPSLVMVVLTSSTSLISRLWQWFLKRFIWLFVKASSPTILSMSMMALFKVSFCFSSLIVPFHVLFDRAMTLPSLIAVSLPLLRISSFDFLACAASSIHLSISSSFVEIFTFKDQSPSLARSIP